MLLTLDDFSRLLKAKTGASVNRILHRNKSGRFEMVMNGSVYNRSGDKQYVLDNVKSKASHVELFQNDELMYALYPSLKEVIKLGDINIQPGQFVLMEDIYQLPDTGDWNTGTEIDEAAVEDKAICQNFHAHVHEGTVIDNSVINNLRRRTSYLLKDGKFIRSREASFKMRARPQHVLVVVDTEDAQKQLEGFALKSPHYIIDYYIIEDAGISLKKLDKGQIEHIGLVKHMMTLEDRPDVVLFEPHREKQLAKTETTIMENSTKISSRFDFKGMKCGMVDLGTSPENLHEEIMKILAEKISDDEKEFDEGQSEGDAQDDENAEDNENGSQDLVAQDLDLQKLLGHYSEVCSLFGLSTDAIREKISDYQTSASGLADKVIDKKLAGMVNTMDGTGADKAAALTKLRGSYRQKYAEQVRNLNESLIFELLSRDTLTLYQAAFRRQKGEAWQSIFESRKNVVKKQAIKDIREKHTRDTQKTITLEDAEKTYTRDIDKIVNIRMVEYLSEELKQSAPASS